MEIVNKVREQMLPKDEFKQLSTLYKMFSDNTRIQILWALEYSELCLRFGYMTKSTILHQLKSLRIANLVKSRRKGKNVYYSLADDHITDILTKGFGHINE